MSWADLVRLDAMARSGRSPGRPPGAVTAKAAMARNTDGRTRKVLGREVPAEHFPAFRPWVTCAS